MSRGVYDSFGFGACLLHLDSGAFIWFKYSLAWPFHKYRLIKTVKTGNTQLSSLHIQQCWVRNTPFIVSNRCVKNLVLISLCFKHKYQANYLQMPQPDVVKSMQCSLLLASYLGRQILLCCQCLWSILPLIKLLWAQKSWVNIAKSFMLVIVGTCVS